MARYRTALPQLGNGLFLSDGGLETTLIFHDGIELPDFAAFLLLSDATGHAARIERQSACSKRFEQNMKEIMSMCALHTKSHPWVCSIPPPDWRGESGATRIHWL